MTTEPNLVVFAIVSLSLTFAFVAPSIAVKTFPIQLAYAQSVQTTPPSTSTPTFTPPGSSTPTHTFPTDNNTTATNSTSGNATTTK